MIRWSGAAFVLLLTAAIAFAETPPPPGPMNVPRTNAPITLDGDLSDAAWQQAAVIDKFYETSPSDNIPAKIRTVAYITYDGRYFYIGVRCDDPQPQKIRAPFVDRDAVIGTDDNIAVFLDTRNDRRSAMEFRVNPRGIQADGIFNDANGNEDFSPDFFYDTAARIDDQGWSAEFRIPFSSLRYDRGDPQTWNILVWRNYPRDYRYGFHSAPLPRGSNCLVCNTHPLTGLTGLPAAGHLVAAPYVTASNFAQPEGGPGSDLGDGDSDFDAGLDVKWNPSANNAVDLTLNPDFSQIEADVPQITTNRRFAVFYPEKRPFFLEGFDFFDTPMNVAYTRTITSPRAGARVTGKLGRTGYTVLLTQDRGGGLAILPGPQGSDFAAQDFKSYATIARVRHDIGASFVGAVLTDREVSGGGHNRVLGPDFQWRPSGSDSITGQFLYSDTTNPDRPDLSTSWNGEDLQSYALTASWGHLKPTHDWFFRYRDLGDDFRADLGFIPQVGYREGYGEFGKRYFPEGLIRFARPFVTGDLQLNQDGDTIFQQTSVGVNGYGAKNFQYFLALYPGEQIRVGNELLTQSYVSWFLQYDPSRRFPRVSFQGQTGEQINFGNGTVGDGTSLSATATIRPHDRLDLQLYGAREWLDDDGGRVYTETIERLRAQYSFSAKSLLRVIVQYDNIERGNGSHGGNFLGSVLYSYKLNWQTVLFVGYGDDRVILPSNDLAKTGRTLFLKVSYAYQR